MSRINNSQEKGYIVLITVLVLGVIAVTTAAFLLLSGQNSSISSGAVDGNVQAKAASGGCAQLALLAIQQSPGSPSPLSGSQTLNSSINETCNYTISGTNPNYSISSLGSVVNGYTSYYHQITITVNATSPQVSVSSWQDTPY
ncbi:MAG TPA: hypothetical protein VMR34_02685 [Candidatus Saccharimonadales bacterium]|nr:hypothetical protein [Candidatus Saccharimonadales bacterium]